MSPRRDERGVVAPSRVVVLAVAAVVLAGAGYFLTAPDDAPKARTAAKAVPSSTPTPTATASAKPTTKKPPSIKRKDVLVEVFNNSGIKGLAQRTSGQASAAGWNVLGSDNWYGTIPATTVYYPPQLERAARALAKDLGITRLKPAIDPMGFDRLTVILTRDYA